MRDSPAPAISYDIVPSLTCGDRAPISQCTRPKTDEEPGKPPALRPVAVSLQGPASHRSFPPTRLSEAVSPALSIALPCLATLCSRTIGRTDLYPPRETRVALNNTPTVDYSNLCLPTPDKCVRVHKQYRLKLAGKCLRFTIHDDHRCFGSGPSWLIYD